MLFQCWSTVYDARPTLVQFIVLVPNLLLMLAHCLRRCANISPALGQRVVFSGMYLPSKQERRCTIVVLMLDTACDADLKLGPVRLALISK